MSLSGCWRTSELDLLGGDSEFGRMRVREMHMLCGIKMKEITMNKERKIPIERPNDSR